MSPVEHYQIVGLPIVASVLVGLVGGIALGAVFLLVGIRFRQDRQRTIGILLPIVIPIAFGVFAFFQNAQRYDLYADPCVATERSRTTEARYEDITEVDAVVGDLRKSPIKKPNAFLLHTDKDDFVIRWNDRWQSGQTTIKGWQLAQKIVDRSRLQPKPDLSKLVAR